MSKKSESVVVIEPRSRLVDAVNSALDEAASDRAAVAKNAERLEAALFAKSVNDSKLNTAYALAAGDSTKASLVDEARQRADEADAELHECRRIAVAFGCRAEERSARFASLHAELSTEKNDWRSRVIRDFDARLRTVAPELVEVLEWGHMIAVAFGAAGALYPALQGCRLPAPAGGPDLIASARVTLQPGKPSLELSSSWRERVELRAVYDAVREVDVLLSRLRAEGRPIAN